jgi:hypothetical protein
MQVLRSIVRGDLWPGCVARSFRLHCAPHGSELMRCRFFAPATSPSRVSFCSAERK